MNQINVWDEHCRRTSTVVALTSNAVVFAAGKFQGYQVRCFSVLRVHYGHYMVHVLPGTLQCIRTRHGSGTMDKRDTTIPGWSTKQLFIACATPLQGKTQFVIISCVRLRSTILCAYCVLRTRYCCSTNVIHQQPQRIGYLIKKDERSKPKHFNADETYRPVSELLAAAVFILSIYSRQSTEYPCTVYTDKLYQAPGTRYSLHTRYTAISYALVLLAGPAG